MKFNVKKLFKSKKMLDLRCEKCNTDYQLDEGVAGLNLHKNLCPNCLTDDLEFFKKHITDIPDLAKFECSKCNQEQTFSEDNVDFVLSYFYFQKKYGKDDDYSSAVLKIKHLTTCRPCRQADDLKKLSRLPEILNFLANGEQKSTEDR